MRIIGFDEADRLLSWPAVADAIEAGHRLAEPTVGDLLLENAGDSLLNRGAWIPGLGIALKSVTVFSKNQRATPPRPSVQGGVLLFDADTGAPTALIDGIVVTKWKTAGDSVLGARLLARPDARTLVVCGAGTLAESLVGAYTAVFPALERIRVWNRNAARAEALVSRFADNAVPVECVPEDALAEAVGEADIVSTATMASEPFVRGDWLSPGVHLDLIGAFKPTMREADDRALQRGELFVDAKRTTIGHIGEIQIPLDTGAIAETDIRGELRDLVAGRAGRSGPDAVTVYKNGGGAHLDLMVARLVMDRAEAAGA